MTHSDIFTKFLIEYDKDNITSSYPSLTKYEIATLLDKAYLALIAQKVTGNNPRRAGFEYDTKAIEDLRQLEKSAILNRSYAQNLVSNEFAYNLPDDYLYYIEGQITLFDRITSIDNHRHTTSTVQLLNHDLAKGFKATDVNMPWIKQPVAYIEGVHVRTLVDPHKCQDEELNPRFVLTYIKKPNKFVVGEDSTDFSDTPFELTDSMAEELINLAILFVTEIVESPRLQTKTSTIQLES